MIGSFSAVAVLLVGAVVSVHGLKCHEGFNMSFNGVPLYHWKERICNGDSKCIGEQIGVNLNMKGITVKTVMRYGACIASAYAEYLDCEKLFGKDSTFDPADLLNLIPEIQKSIMFLATSFSQNTTAELHALLSDGSGSQSFIAGSLTFLENLGFNMKKVRQIEKPLAKLFSALFSTKGPHEINNAVAQLLNALSNLDTDNAEYRTAIRSILVNLGANMAQVDANPGYTALIDKLPGLVRSIFTTSMKPELWFDVGLKLVGNVDVTNWTKTAEDMVTTIKTSYQIPADIRTYVIPILDRIPDLVRGSLINPNYGGQWALELLKHFSAKDQATMAFSSALTNFTEKLINSTLPPEFKTMITWMPGLFYKFFPGDKAPIQDVYNKMAEGFNSFNFTNLNMTAPKTTLSMMIKNLITTFGGQALFQTNPFFNAVIVNFSQMFYKLMKTTTDYTTYVDKFAKVIDDEFKKWPNINGGAMITKLVTEMGGTVPPEVKPLLDNLQPVIAAAMASPFSGTNLTNAMYKITDAYKMAFPGSPFPDLAHQCINITYLLVTNMYPYKAMALIMEMVYWSIDLEFAIINSMDLTKDEFYKMLVKAWPQYGLYIRAMQMMKPEDVKQVVKNIVAWISTPPPHTSDGFVKAVQPTFKKITKSIKDLLGEIRQMSAPDSCRFGSCDTDLCNSHGYIAARQEYTKASSQVTQSTTTAAGEKASFNILLNIATLWMANKIFFA